MEQLTAICINDKTERDRKIKVLGITEGKEYPVKLCRYPNYYELVNDMGNVETYFMDRFEIREKPIIEVEKIKFYGNGDVTYPISEEEYKKGVEGKKMEDKIKREVYKKIKCITDDSINLTKNKEYETYQESEKFYWIKENDNGASSFYIKECFEKVEDVIMVECIDNEGYEDRITLNKKYPVIDIDEGYYIINDDRGVRQNFYMARFKPAEPQKEVKEYTVMELFEEKEETKFKDSEGNLYIIRNSVMMKLYEDEEARELLLNKRWFEKRFTKVEEAKPVTFIDAWKAYGEEKTIESVESRNKYKKDEDPDGGLLVKRESEYKDRCESLDKLIKDEEEYNRLRTENEELKATNKALVEEIKDHNINYQVNIKELHEEIDQVMEEKENYHTQMVILQEDNKEYKRANEGLAAESKERLQTIKKFKRLIEDNTENAILSNKVEDLENELIDIKSINGGLSDKIETIDDEYQEEIKGIKKELEKVNDINRNINNQNACLKREVEEGNEVLENEYHNKIFLAEQKINSLSTEVACLKAFKEKDNKQIQNLKEAVKSMAAAL